MEFKIPDADQIIKCLPLLLAVATIFSGVYEISYFMFIGIGISDFPIGISDLSKSVLIWSPFAVFSIFIGILGSNSKDKKLEEILSIVEQVNSSPENFSVGDVNNVKLMAKSYHASWRRLTSIELGIAGFVAIAAGFLIWFFDGFKSILFISAVVSILCFSAIFIINLDNLAKFHYKNFFIISAGAGLILGVFFVGSLSGESELYKNGRDSIRIEGVDLLGVNIADTFDKGILYTKDGKAYFIMWDKVDSISYDTKIPSRMACQFRMCDRRILSIPHRH